MTMPIEIAIEGAGALSGAAAAGAGALEGAGTVVEGAGALVEGAEVAAAPLDIAEGVSGTVNTDALVGEAGEGEFGDLADEVDAADDIVDVDPARDADLLDEADLDGGEAEVDDVDAARRQVKAALDEPVVEADATGAGAGNPNDAVPPTGGSGDKNGGLGDGDADPADGEAGDSDEGKIVDAELVEGEGTDEIRAADDRPEAGTDIQEADVVEVEDADADADGEDVDADGEDADADGEDADVDEPDPDADREDADADADGEDVDADGEDADADGEDADVDEPDPDADREDADADADETDEDDESDETDDDWEELDELNDLQDQFDHGLDELNGLVRQREEITARDPFSDELGAINESIDAVNERLLGVQHEIQTIQYNADLQLLDEYLDRATDPDPSISDDDRELYTDLATEMRDQLTNTLASLQAYEAAHPGPDYTGGRDTSVIPNELLGLHPRELVQIRDAVNGKLDELYPNHEGSTDEWVRTGAQPFQEYIRHIDNLLGQREARLATMPTYARAAYLAREAAAGLRRAAMQGALRHLEERTRGNLAILGDRIRDMHPVDRPDHAAEHAQDIIDQSTARQGDVRHTGGTFEHIRSAISDYRHSRGLHDNGTTVRVLEAEQRIAERRARMIGEQAVEKDKIGGFDADRVARHQGGNGSRQTGGNKGGSGDGKPAPKGGKAVRAARAVKRHVDTRRAHNVHKANRKKLEHKIEQIRKAHPVKYYLSPLLQVVGLHHKELAAAQAELQVVRANERATGLPAQIGGALVDKVLG